MMNKLRLYIGIFICRVGIATIQFGEWFGSSSKMLLRVGSPSGEEEE